MRKELRLLINKIKLRIIYNTHGIISLNKEWLEEHGFSSLYYNLRSHRESVKKLADDWGISEEFRQFRHEKCAQKQGKQIWTREAVCLYAKNLIDEFGYLPARGILELDKKHNPFIHGVHFANMTYTELHEILQDNKDPRFRSRDGKIWRSHAEAAFANFLYARGVDCLQGQPYPKEFKETYKVNAVYDGHIPQTIQGYLHYEIWGDNPGGHCKKQYAEKRKMKEEFNSDKTFLGIHYLDCFKEEKLTELLKPFIGLREIVNAKTPADIQTKSSNWSRMDDVLTKIKIVQEKHALTTCPSKGWLCQNNLSYLDSQISDVGGYILVRSLLHQPPLRKASEKKRRVTIETE